jgi:hypothetical protein
MREAETSANLTKLARARLFRNGLMIALLACCPIRLKNFVALEIGRSIVQIKNAWWIVLPASETKERRPDERPFQRFSTTRSAAIFACTGQFYGEKTPLHVHSGSRHKMGRR